MPLLFAVLVGAAAAAPSVALFYGGNAPLDELHAFDIAVVDPDHGADPVAYRRPYSELYAYVAVGEANPARLWFKDIPAAWKLASNRAWGSAVLDLAQPAWRDFLVERVVAPLWSRGYRGFFLDTLDAYRLAAKFDEAAEQQGLINLIDTLHDRFPGIHLILNRGFDVVPRVKDKIRMVAAESLFRGWDATAQSYVEVKAADRDWLLAQLRRIRDEDGVPVLAIDYVDPADRAATRATAERIQALGIVPWVSDGRLESLGIGAVEVMPRRVLVVSEMHRDPRADLADVQRFLAMPLNHLGYLPEYHDVDEPLPAGPLAGRYAGIVTWLSSPPRHANALARWLEHQAEAGLKIAMVGEFGVPLQDALFRRLGVVAAPAAAGAVSVVRQGKGVGFETPPPLDRHDLQPVRLAGPGDPWLELQDGRGNRYDPVAVAPWGGYALWPYAVAELPGADWGDIERTRWVVDPFAFLQAALALPAGPVPDTTTENGRRLLFVHVDGDAFASRAELPGTPLAGEVLLREVLDRYRLPTTFSVIEGETSPDGLYPHRSAQMEALARRIFARPYVEIASHTYSHPFRWVLPKNGDAAADDGDYHLKIPGYRMDPRREIVGSIDYIRRRLAPPGKPVQVLLWSGDSLPGPEALAVAEAAGLLAMNGVGSTIQRQSPTLTAVGALGMEKGGYFHVYAPMMNENLYTRNWTGPFYGFERAIETFEMTEAPRRLKPIDIYYHTYSGSKRASLEALQKVYRWALAQPTDPIFASEFIRKALDFEHLVVARAGADWLVRGAGDLRTLRAPQALGYPDLAASAAVAGFARGAEGNYVHLSGGEARLRFSPEAPTRPYLASANARLTAASAGADQLRLSFAGHVPLEFDLANAAGCTVSADGRRLSGRPAGDTLRFRLDDAGATIDTVCRRP